MFTRTNRRWIVATLVVTAAAAVPEVANAQGGTSDMPVGRVEAAVAGGWLGGTGLGDTDANLRTSGGGDYRLFSAESRFRAAPMLEARVAYGLTRRYTVEGRFAFSRPELRTSISADVEEAPALDVAEKVDHYTFEGALVVMLPGLRIGSLVPFASAGAGYLRELHEGLTLVEEGIAYHGGGGVKHQLFVRPRGVVRAAGFRGDVRLYFLTGGIELNEEARPHLAASGAFYVTF